MGKYIAAWFPMMLIAILNGAFRESVLAPFLGSHRAHQASTVTLFILLFFYAGFLIRAWRPRSGRQALLVGLVWLAMTLVFEFGFGHFIAGRPWTVLFQDYNLFAGRLWVVIPVWTAAAPCVFYRYFADS